MTETTPSPLNKVITIDDERIKNHLDRIVRGSVEETLNALLDAEADRLCNAQRYERSEARRDTRAGHYERKLQTKAGEVRLKVPKLRAQTFETRASARLFRQAAALPCGDGGLRDGAFLGTRAPPARARCAASASTIREALCQTRQERRSRCCCHLRGCEPPFHAVRTN